MKNSYLYSVTLSFFFLFVLSNYFPAQDGWADNVISTIDIGDRPSAIEYNPSNNNIYVTNHVPAIYGEGHVSVIDSSTNEVIDTITVGAYPYAIEYNPSNNNMYVANFDSGDVSVIDSSTNEVIQTIVTGSRAAYVEYNPSNNNIYVVNHDAGTVSVIDSSTNEVIDTITVGRFPFTSEYNPLNNDIYVAKVVSCDESNQISIIDSQTNNLDSIPIGCNPTAIIFNPSNDDMYVSVSDNTVSVIDSLSNDVKDIVNVGRNPVSLEFNPTNDDLYVPNVDSDTVSVIDSSTNEVIDTLNVGNGPYLTEYNPSNNNMYVANQYSNDVSVIETTPRSDLKPIADAGLDQIVNGNDLVQLDGSNSSDPNGFPLSYLWNQTAGPEVTLRDPSSSNPTFTAPKTTEQTEITFQLVVTNEEGESSEPDEVTITVNPVTTPPPPPNEEPRTIGDIIKGIIQHPLDVTNSVDSANEIRDILTDDNRDNDQIVCDLIDSEDEYTSNIRETLNC